MDLLALLVGLVLGLVVGAVAAVLVLRRRAEAPADAALEPAEDPRVVEARHQVELGRLREEALGARGELESQLARAEAGLDGLREQLVDAQAQYREVIERGRRETEERQAAERAESKVLQALTPVQETLRTMQAKVTELETQRSQQHGQISEQLRTAAESEERLRATAESLASALRNNATRGVWGETQLRNVVEAAGLTNRVDFALQSSISSDAGAGRPDMTVRLPGGKSIAVDAKVPYNSYLEASAIPATATGEEEARRKSLLAAHARQVKSHVDALSGKTYWAGLDASPEFTVAFIPSESLLSAALEQDPTLLDYAFGKRIALASPVNLWAVLKTVAFTWQQDVLTEDAKRLFDLSKELYGRLGILADRATKLGSALESSVKRYNEFASSLETRVLVTARKLDQLDETKVITAPKAVEEQPRPLTAPEFIDAADGSVAADATVEADAPAAASTAPGPDAAAIAEEQRLALAGTERDELDLGLPERDDAADEKRRSA